MSQKKINIIFPVWQILQYLGNGFGFVTSLLFVESEKSSFVTDNGTGISNLLGGLKWDNFTREFSIAAQHPLEVRRVAAHRGGPGMPALLDKIYHFIRHTPEDQHRRCESGQLLVAISSAAMWLKHLVRRRMKVLNRPEKKDKKKDKKNWNDERKGTGNWKGIYSREDSGSGPFWIGKFITYY